MLHSSAEVSDCVRRDVAYHAHPQTGVHGARALVAAATGDGNLPPILLPDLQKPIMRGKVVVPRIVKGTVLVTFARFRKIPHVIDIRAYPI